MPRVKLLLSFQLKYFKSILLRRIRLIAIDREEYFAPDVHFVAACQLNFLACTILLALTKVHCVEET